MIEKFFHDQKNRRRLRFFLYPLSICYKLGVKARRKLYEIGLFSKKKGPLPVVCIGSVFVGGSGKTPFVRLLLEYLPADTFVLSRGYKTADEPIFYKNCVVEKDRFKGVFNCAKLGAKLVIMDDGLQHLSLVKDLSVAVLSKEQVTQGYDYLPLGYLRDDPVALSQAEYVVFHEVDTFIDYERLKQQFSYLKKARFIGTNTSVIGIYTLDKEKVDKIDKVILVSGIARPSRFYEIVNKMGLTILEHHIFDDHQQISDNKLTSFIDAAEKVGAKVLVTEKDAVKYPNHHDLLQLKVETQVCFDQENFHHLVRSIYETLG